MSGCALRSFSAPRLGPKRHRKLVQNDTACWSKSSHRRPPRPTGQSSSLPSRPRRGAAGPRRADPARRVVGSPRCDGGGRTSGRRRSTAPNCSTHWSQATRAHSPFLCQPYDLRDYIERAIRGGFPSLVLDHTPNTRDVWVDSYLEQLLTRDGHLRIADREQYELARYFEAVAANSAGIVEHKTIYDAAAVDRRTADSIDGPASTTCAPKQAAKRSTSSSNSLAAS